MSKVNGYVIDRERGFVVHMGDSLSCYQYIINCQYLYGHNGNRYVTAFGATERNDILKSLKKGK